MNLDRVNLLKWKLLMKDYLGLGKFQVQKNSVHLKETAEWIMRAQDATPDRGVSRMFSLSKGWGLHILRPQDILFLPSWITPDSQEMININIAP